MIEVTVHGLQRDLSAVIVWLKNKKEDRRYLPIWIDEVTANGIAAALQHMKMPRPLTHDLMKTALDRLTQYRMSRAVIHKMIDGVYYAAVYFQGQSIEEQIDSRPSDAIALCLRYRCPIFVEDKVWNKHAITPETSTIFTGTPGTA